jgi:S-adenosylmethionine:tRNA ribosyltransferase-isomerase
MTRIDLFDYELPEELIAQYPAAQRDASRLLVVNRTDGSLEDRHFSDLPDFLHKGDVLVLNDSRVMHARLLGKKWATGANIELFLLKRVEEQVSAPETWEVLAKPARRLKPGDTVEFSSTFSAQVMSKQEDGSLIVSFTYQGIFLEALEQVGHIPLPPYIKREDEAADAQRYQTVYADETGSAAAPTAGLHFTPELLDALRAKGVETAFVTLHVGLGTFRPVQTSTIEEHLMHEEFYHISDTTAAAVEAAKREGRRVVCVGTTSVRTLESAAGKDANGALTIQPGWGSTSIFIYPGGRPFLATDALITNFHLPKSTLLMLVSALYTREKMLEAYAHAITNHYRFFSYGDAMLIL